MSADGLQLNGLRSVELSVEYTGTGAELRIEHAAGHAEIELHGDDLAELAAWIEKRFGS